MADSERPGGYYTMGNLSEALDALAWADKDRDRLMIVMDAFVPVCNCGACRPHASDCAVHDGEVAGPCDCPTGQPGGGDS